MITLDEDFEKVEKSNPFTIHIDDNDDTIKYEITLQGIKITT